jgi:hypothetical protein
MLQFFCFNVNRKLYIVDARPRANALANGAKGGGSESSSNYPKSEVRYAQIGLYVYPISLLHIFFICSILGSGTRFSS